MSQQLDADSLLGLQPSDAPIDTVVVVVMENRSFDHYLGWLAEDQAYLEAGRSRYGAAFAPEGRQKMTYKRPDGKRVQTEALIGSGKFLDPYSGCGYKDPGHGWSAGRAQLTKGFLGKGTGNDEFALGYFGPDEILFQGSLARRFTVLDHYFSSVLGPTWLNREYLNTATTMGKKRHVRPITEGEAKQETIWQRLAAAGVPAFDDSEPDLSTEMIVPCNQFVGVNKVEAEWGVDLDPEFLDLIELEYAAATALPWLQE